MANKEFDNVQLFAEYDSSVGSNVMNVFGNKSKENIAYSLSKIKNWFPWLVPTNGSAGQILEWYNNVPTWRANTNADTVKQTHSTDTDFHPLVLGAPHSASAWGSAISETTDQVYMNKGVYVKPSTSTIYATDYIGNINGFSLTGTSGSTYDLNSFITSQFISSITTTGNGNGVTAIGVNNGVMTVTKGSTFELVGHTHTLSIATDTGNSQLSMSANTKYKLTAGGSTFIFTTPPDSDTKVTSSANHYTPATASGQDKTASASGATAAWSIDVVKGVTLNTDGKGHVTGISVTSGKIPGNPNTDRYVNAASFADDSTNTAASPVKMTLTRAGSDTATVTANIPKVSSTSAGVAPKGAAVSSQSQSTKFLREDGSWAAPSYTSIPSNNVTGSGTSGYLTKWNGTNSITNGPKLGSSTTTFLRNDGEWATPDGTTYSAGTGISLSGTTFSNAGVRSTTINGNYLRVNTNGTNADLTIPYATTASKLGSITVGSGSRPIYLNAGTPTQCDTPTSGAYWAGIPYVGSNGVMEIGKYIDFHGTNTSTADYDYRIQAGSTWLDLVSPTTQNKVTVISPDYSVIQFQTTKTSYTITQPVIYAYPLTTSGLSVLFQSGGNTVIGGGESASTLYTNDYDSMTTVENESLYLASDSSEIHLITNAQSYGTRKVLKVADGQLVKTGGLWIWARDTAPVYANKPNTQDGGYYPAWFAKTKSGGWSMGVLSTQDNLYLTYTTDTDYSGGTNNNTYQVKFQNKSGTVALTSDIPTADDHKVTQNNLTSGGTFPVILGGNTSAATVTDYVNKKYDALRLGVAIGTTSTDGYGELLIGNATASGTAGNAYGKISLYSSNTAGAVLRASSTASWRTFYFPGDKGGTVAVTTDLAAYLPLAGGTMNTSTSITIPYGTGNIIYDGGSGLAVHAPTNIGWARGIDYYVGSTWYGGFGGNGSGGTFDSLYIGKYNDKTVQIDPINKITTFNGKVTMSQDAYVGGNLYARLSQKTNKNRQSTANLACGGTGSMQLILATSTMDPTTERPNTGKPASDGFILDFDWDNTGQYKAQIFVSNSGASVMQWRGQTGSSDWSAANSKWHTLVDSINFKPYKSITQRFFYFSGAGWRRIMTIRSGNNNGYVTNDIKIFVRRHYNNASPESFSFHVINNYNSIKIRLLHAEQYVQLFDGIRVSKSSDSKYQYIEINYTSANNNAVSVRYDIISPYTTDDTAEQNNPTYPADGTLAAISDSPTPLASLLIPTGISQFNLRQVNGWQGGYFGMADATGGDSAWIRTTSNGLIPYTEGAATTGGNSYLGASGWYFKEGYISKVYANTIDCEALAPRHTNEINFKSPGSTLWFGYRIITDDKGSGTTSPTTPISTYLFGCGKGGGQYASIRSATAQLQTSGASYYAELTGGSLTYTRTIHAPDANGTMSVSKLVLTSIGATTGLIDVPTGARYLVIEVFIAATSVKSFHKVAIDTSCTSTSLIQTTTKGQYGLQLTIQPIQFTLTNATSITGGTRYTLTMNVGSVMSISAGTTPSAASASPQITKVYAQA